ncbi:MAG: hypothetical protein ABTQ26_12890 [Azonexus sp.]
MRTNFCLALILSVLVHGQVLAGEDTNDLKTANDELFHSDKLDKVIRYGTMEHPVDEAAAALKEKFHKIVDPSVNKVGAKFRSIGERLGIESDDSIGRSEQDDKRYGNGTVPDDYWKEKARTESYKSRLSTMAGSNSDDDGPDKLLPPEAKRACDSIIADPSGRRDCYKAYRAVMPRTTVQDAIKDERYPRNLEEAKEFCDQPTRREWTLQPVAVACREEMTRRFGENMVPGSDRLQSMLNDTGGRKAGGAGLEGIMQQQQQQEHAAAEAARQARIAQQQREVAARQAAARAQQQREAAAAQQAAAQAQAEYQSDNGMAEFGQVLGAAMNALSRRAYAPSYPTQRSGNTALGSQSGGTGVGSQSYGTKAPPPTPTASPGRSCRAQDGCGIQ